jgi:hypothetical protein
VFFFTEYYLNVDNCILICYNIIKFHKGSKKSKMDIYKCPKLKKIIKLYFTKK